jgi:hypothetical protein
MFPIHNTFPKEMAIIGRILLDYGLPPATTALRGFAVDLRM